MNAHSMNGAGAITQVAALPSQTSLPALDAALAPYALFSIERNGAMTLFLAVHKIDDYAWRVVELTPENRKRLVELDYDPTIFSALPIEEMRGALRFMPMAVSLRYEHTKAPSGMERTFSLPS